MAKLTDFRLLSFDVYGTLIDWETGVINNLKPLLQRHDSSAQPSKARILEVYHDLEKAQRTKTPDMPYSQLVTTICPEIVTRFGLPAPSAQDAEIFGQSVGEWPAFSDTVDALQRLAKDYKLVVLSNVDRESFAKSYAGPLSGAKFDHIITAQDVGSYKPDLRNFEHLLTTVKEKFGVGKDQILQTAQSQFHDHHPAEEMGIKSVWIERGGIMGNRGELVYDWKFTTLGEMADAVGAGGQEIVEIMLGWVRYLEDKSAGSDGTDYYIFMGYAHH